MADHPLSIVAMTEPVIVEEQVEFTFTTLCRASGADPRQLQALVGEGLLQPSGGHEPEAWQFGGSALRRARTALRLARGLELDLPAVAVVMDLLDEIEHLKSQLRR